MPRFLVASALLVIAGFPSRSVALSPQRAKAPARNDPLEQLERWMERFRREAPVLDPEFELELMACLSELRRIQGAEPDRRREIIPPLLDLAGIVPATERLVQRHGLEPEPAYLPDRITQQVRDTGQRVLEVVFGGEDSAELFTWLASSVLAQPRFHSLERRLAAVSLMRGRYQPGTLLALFTCGSAPERQLREAAVEALVGWKDENVHRFLAGQVLHALSDPKWTSLDVLRKHFERVPLAPDSPAAAELASGLGRAALAADWRSSLRAIEALATLSDPLAVPPLIECFSTWLGRGERGSGSRRLEGALLRELRRRSGRSIGPYPERWTLWWKAVQSGQVSSGPRDEQTAETRASFFGLHPMTDRVVFVIDRSGSMEAQFGTHAGKQTHSRYAEAVRQLQICLTELGPRTRFNVVLFSEAPVRWRNSLEPASPSNLSTAGSWVRQCGTGGGTNLRPGIFEALELDAAGRPDLKRLEADTVIILCDGATAEGPGWVESFLSSSNREACIVFHSVQIGAGGDGTLELLAKETGGEFVRVL